MFCLAIFLWNIGTDIDEYGIGSCEVRVNL